MQRKKNESAVYREPYIHKTKLSREKNLNL